MHKFLYPRSHQSETEQAYAKLIRDSFAKENQYAELIPLADKIISAKGDLNAVYEGLDDLPEGVERPCEREEPCAPADIDDSDDESDSSSSTSSTTSSSSDDEDDDF